MHDEARPIVWLKAAVSTPPFSREARVEAGTLLRRLQQGEVLSLPHSRPMPVLGPRCHELRVPDEDVTWRVLYRIDPDAIVVAHVFAKKARTTPKSALDLARQRLRVYDHAISRQIPSAPDG